MKDELRSINNQLRLIYVLIAIVLGWLLVTDASAEGVKLYSEDGKYLGKLNSNPYDPESISNPYGRYGSKYSQDSINNPYSKYGSQYSSYSPYYKRYTYPQATFKPRPYRYPSYAYQTPYRSKILPKGQEGPFSKFFANK